jgi:hypothetical protein
MSATTLNAILFFGTFPALWLLAWCLERFCPDSSERDRKARASKEESGQGKNR